MTARERKEAEQFLKDNYDLLLMFVEDHEIVKYKLLEAMTEFKKLKPIEDEKIICDVFDCKNEAVNQGNCWNKTGYWCVCSGHSQLFRSGGTKPVMKREAIDRENSRDKITGRLP